MLKAIRILLWNISCRPLVVLLFLPFLILYSCDEEILLRPAENLEEVERYFPGGTVTIGHEVKIKSLHPFSASDELSKNLINNVYEGLFLYDPKDLLLKPALVGSWEINTDRTVYTFYLREGVMFHDNDCFNDVKGPEVTAGDVEFCLRKFIEIADSSNMIASDLRQIISGADAYYRSRMNKQIEQFESIKGIKVINRHTITVELNSPYCDFLYLLARPELTIYSMKCYSDGAVRAGQFIPGTGPFRQFSVSDNGMILIRNNNYWGKNSSDVPLPYLDTVKIQFVKNKSELVSLVKDKKLDIIQTIPEDQIESIINPENRFELKFVDQALKLQSSPALELVYIGFMGNETLLRNLFLRKAIYYVIDKSYINDTVYNNFYIPAEYGIVPPAIVGYDARKLDKQKDLEKYDPEIGAAFLRSAGYISGNELPEIYIFTEEDESYKKIGQELRWSLSSHLNIRSKIGDKNSIDTQILNKNLCIWVGSINSPYPTSLGFLYNIFRRIQVPIKIDKNNGSLNTRVELELFNDLMNFAIMSKNDLEENKIVLKADSIATEEVAILPLIYKRYFRIQNARIRNSDLNPIGLINLRRTFFVPKETQPIL